MVSNNLSSASRHTNSILGMNIDGNRVLLLYSGLTGHVQERIAFAPQREDSFQTVLEQIAVHADRLLTLTQAQHLPVPDRISAAVSGNYDNETGILDSSRDVPNWKSVAIKSQLSLRFNLPVFMEHKANAGVLAESIFGAGQDVLNQVYVSQSPTVRLGMLFGSQLYRNVSGTAGSLGDIRMTEDGPAGLGSPGSLNGYASAAGLAEWALLSQGTHWDAGVTAAEIIEAAQAGDPYAEELLKGSAARLGQGLAAVVHLLRPGLITIGDPFNQLGESYALDVRTALMEASGLNSQQLPRVEASTLGKRLPELEALAPAIFAARQSPPA